MDILTSGLSRLGVAVAAETASSSAKVTLFWDAVAAATRGWTPCCKERLEVRALSRPFTDSDTRLLPFSCLTEELVDVLRFRSR